MKKLGIFLLLTFGGAISAEETSIDLSKKSWFTGPLIAPYGTIVPLGSFKVRSYLYYMTNTGFYDKNWDSKSRGNNFYSLIAQFQCFLGLTPWCDLNIIPEVICSSTSGQYYCNSGDLKVGIDFQLMQENYTPYFPGIKFSVREIFPTGNFQRFSPRKENTDKTGEGTFRTELELILYKVFHLYGPHFLSLTASAGYTVNTAVNVHGFNAYGGGFGTCGKVLPGDQFQGILSFEITLNHNWALALDTVYKQQTRSQFFGTPGIYFNGKFAKVAPPSSEQVSFAPAIEYNFSKNFGIIAGCWFSATGRNSEEFRSGIINLQYTY